MNQSATRSLDRTLSIVASFPKALKVRRRRSGYVFYVGRRLAHVDLSLLYLVCTREEQHGDRVACGTRRTRNIHSVPHLRHLPVSQGVC